MDSKHNLYKILMLPWLAHGHVSPFLELAKRLEQKNFQVYICSTPVNLSPFRESNPSGLIQFIDLHLPSTSELPPEQHSTRNLPTHLMPVLKTAFDEAQDNFRAILRELKPHLVIYDFVQPWAPAVAQIESIPAVLLLSCSTVSSAFLYHYAEYPDLDYPFPELIFPKKLCQKFMQFFFDVSNGLTDKERFFQCIANSSNFVLIKTLWEIEKKHIDYLSKLVGKEVIPVGPLVQDPENKSSDSAFMNWLGQRGHSSTVFVSFGSEYFLSMEEIEEIAYGLELSMLSFIWVVRFHGTANITSLHEVLPQGFQERVAERGMVVEGWAPQAKILGHPSTGGFVSHCGWSSALESIAFGVPIIAMPMQLDQPMNGRLVVEIGVGIDVPRENGKFRKEEIARVAREVVVEEKGKEVRRQVKEMSNTIKQKGDQEIDIVVRSFCNMLKCEDL